MAKIFQKTIQHFNILIEDKLGKFLLTKNIPYQGVQFPTEGLMRYGKSKNLTINKDIKVLRYKHKVSKQDASLQMLVTFWLKSEKQSEEIASLVKQELSQKSDDLIKEYRELIKQGVITDGSIFVWQGSAVQFKYE